MIDPNTADMIAVGIGFFGTGIVSKIVWDWLKGDRNRDSFCPSHMPLVNKVDKIANDTSYIKGRINE